MRTRGPSKLVEPNCHYNELVAPMENPKAAYVKVK